jgi:cobalt-zinc-cadmium efflux system outer membrane protein
VLTLALALGPAARGEDAVRLTLDEALAGLRRQNPELLAGALQVRAAHGDVITAGLLPNPTLSAGVGNFPLGRTNPSGIGVGDTVVSQVGLEEEVLLPGKRGARLTAARRREDAAAEERADLERRLTFELRARFVALLEASERLRLAHENLDRYRETVRVSEARAREGEISHADLDKIALEQRGFEREVADAETDRREAVAALLPLVGVDAADVEPVGALALPPPPEDVEHLVSEALARRPDLRAADRAAEAAEAALRLARAERWPNPTLGLQYTHSEFLVSGDLANQVGTSVSVPLPVFNRNQGEIERAAAEELVARHEVEKLRLAIPQEVRSAVTSLAIARERVARFEEAFLRQAREARHAAEVSFREGAASLLEFLEAERTYVQTEREHLAALRDVNTAAFDVTRAAALEVSP